MKLLLALYFFVFAIIQAGLFFGVNHYYRSQPSVRPSPYWMNSLLVSVAALFIFGAGIFTVDDIAALNRRQNERCAHCEAHGRLEIDHIMPVARGGRNDPANLQLLCLPCNRSKGKKTMDEWRAAQVK